MMVCTFGSYIETFLVGASIGCAALTAIAYYITRKRK